MTDHMVNVIDQVPNNYSKNSVWDIDLLIVII
jgi:hypothetical protein